MVGEIVFGLQAFILIIQSGLAFLVGYLVLLAGASRQASPITAELKREPDCRFLVIIPAHNEERLLGSTLDSLANLNYPSSLYAVHVVADNCTDQTAEIAASKGAFVHIRTNQEQLGKGYALQWLLHRIWENGIDHDGVVFLDADSIVSHNFLQVMAARLARGEKVIQAYYAVREPEQSWNGALRYAALSVLHYLRPQGRMVIGGSAGLKGNGMVFASDVMKQYKWPASLTEDIELHMALILNGERVTFAPDAVVWGEMPNSFSQMKNQHMRWERGRLEMANRYVPALLKTAKSELKTGNHRRSFLLVDAAMEHIIPPFSILAGLTGLCLLASLLINAASSTAFKRKSGNQQKKLQKLGIINLVLGIGLLFGQVLYLLAGLRQVRAPRHIYWKLLYAPFLIIWKLKQYAEAVISRKQLSWIRTERNGG